MFRGSFQFSVQETVKYRGVGAGGVSFALVCDSADQGETNGLFPEAFTLYNVHLRVCQFCPLKEF